MPSIASRRYAGLEPNVPSARTTVAAKRSAHALSPGGQRIVNLNDTPTITDLRGLFRGADDVAAHHVLWVDLDGEVKLTPLPEELGPVGLKRRETTTALRYETFQQGNGYVGEEAFVGGQSKPLPAWTTWTVGEHRAWRRPKGRDRLRRARGIWPRCEAVDDRVEERCAGGRRRRVEQRSWRADRALPSPSTRLPALGTRSP